MNSAIPAVCVLVASLGLHGPAQEPDRRWTELERSQGLTVAIDVTDESRFVGTLLHVDVHSLVLRVRGDDRQIERGRIRRITSKRRDSLKNGILTGAVIGAGMAAGSGCYVGDRKCGKAGRAAFVAFGAALWSGIGAAIDASRQKRMTLYEAASGPRETPHHVSTRTRAVCPPSLTVVGVETLSNRNLVGNEYHRRVARVSKRW